MDMKPPITGNHTSRCLSPCSDGKTFERLCLWLVQREGYEQG